MFEYGARQAVDPDRIRRMNKTLVHRGPDEEGFFLRPHVGLGARRLSIIDLAGSHQPATNEDAAIVVVFNGEIYNYRRLRDELLRTGHDLRTRGDTEVIPHLYEEYGTACVDHLDGMFAFALFDGREGAASETTQGGRLLLFRDRLGKKPLYYADLGGTLVFASEIKAILEDPRVSRELDVEALHHYLSLSFVPAPFSIFKAIRKLPPGSLLECDGQGLRVRSYWDYLSKVKERDVTEEEATAEVRKLLFEAVEKRMAADVPLGAFLSGGLDSSTVVAIMSRLKNEAVRTFSVGFEGPESYNELPHARVLARHCRTDHHEVQLCAGSLELLLEVVRYADEPFAISSAIPLLLLSRWARQQVTVVLTGDGGDEVFGGYAHYVYERWVSAYRRLPPLVDRLLAGATGLVGGRLDGRPGSQRARAMRFATYARATAGQRRIVGVRGFTEAEKRWLYGPSSAPPNSLRSTVDFLEGRVERCGGKEPTSKTHGLDMLVWLPDEMLTKVDRMTMGASLEARCPFLDWRLVEYLAGLSFDVKVHGWSRSGLKHLMRRAIADLLPAELFARPKHGFDVPLDNWFREGARGFLESVLSPERLRRRGIFSPAAVSELLTFHQQGKIHAGGGLFKLLVFEVWAESYL